MVEVVSISQMKAIEQAADGLGLSYAQMMENAGYSAFKNIEEKIGFDSRKCAVFCGKGNNGGDGLVLARYATKVGAEVTIILTEGYPKTENAVINIEKIKEMNIPILSTDFNASAINEKLENIDIIIDAIYGTGYRGSLSEQDKRVFKQINNAVAAIFSLDVPSGMNGDTGEYDEDCIKADFTVTFDSIKPCHIIPNSSEKCGQVEVVDIGVPEEVRRGHFFRAGVITEDMFKEALPERTDNGHKGTFGHVLNIAGSVPYRGAAILSSKAAAVSGAGYVTLMSIPEVCQATAGYMPEITYMQQDKDENGFIKLPKFSSIYDKLRKANVISIGCGMGKPKDRASFISDLISLQNKPVVLDADGLNSLMGTPEILNKSVCPVVITPHPGEMARLLGITTEEVEKNRYQTAYTTAVKYGVTVVLKGHNTIVASPDGDVLINCTGNSGLSKAGSGDVLTGMITGFIAQGIDIKKACIAAVYMHGKTAEKCGKRLSKHSMQPSDLFYDMSEIFNEIENA